MPKSVARIKKQIDEIEHDYDLDETLPLPALSLLDTGSKGCADVTNLTNLTNLTTLSIDKQLRQLIELTKAMNHNLAEIAGSLKKPAKPRPRPRAKKKKTRAKSS